MSGLRRLKSNLSNYPSESDLDLAYIEESSIPKSNPNLDDAFILYSDDQLISVCSSSHNTVSNVLGSLANQESSIFELRDSQCSQSAKQLFHALQPLFRKDNAFIRKSPRFYSQPQCSNQYSKQESETSKSKNMSIQYDKPVNNTQNTLDQNLDNQLSSEQEKVDMKNQINWQSKFINRNIKSDRKKLSDTQILEEKYEEQNLKNIHNEEKTKQNYDKNVQGKMLTRNSKKIVLEEQESSNRSIKQQPKKQKKIKKLTKNKQGSYIVGTINETTYC